MKVKQLYDIVRIMKLKLWHLIAVILIIIGIISIVVYRNSINIKKTVKIVFPHVVLNLTNNSLPRRH
jgi:hypothetical protein